MKEKFACFKESVSQVLEDGGAGLAKSGYQFFVGVLLVLIFFSLFFHKTFITLSLVIVLLAVLWHMMVKDAVEAPYRGAIRKWLYAIFYLAAVCIGLSPYCLFSKIMGRVNASTTFLGAVFVGVSIGLTLLFITSDMGKKFFELVDAGFSSVKSSNPSESHAGDVVLCDVKEMVEAKAKDCREIIPYKDRFLHMLILGATGSGKTSQVILPMCYQDIQNLDAGLTVLEPKGDLAREVAMMAKDLGRPYIYFDPSVDNCPFFNPLIGEESDVIENAVVTFNALNPDSPQYFKDLSEQLVRNSLKVLKRLDKDKGIDGYYSTFIWMSRVLQNNGGQGRELVQRFSRIHSSTPDEAKENADIASWFLNEYFAERSKIYENSSGIRSQVSKVIANQYLRHILNPDVEKGEYNQVDFDKHLADGGVICISTAQGLLRDLGKFLGYFLILQFKSAVFRRPGTEDNRRAHWLYIDEFQQYSTPGFSEMLTQGRSYRVACHLATQARAQMAMGGGRDGKNFVELVSTNARNIVIFPGGSKDDAEFYSKQFGEYEKTEVMKSYTRKTFNLFTGGLDRLGHPSESERISTKMTATFSPSDLIYRPFGEIVYCIIKNNTLQTPKVGLVKWLNKEYDSRMKQMIEEEIVTHEYRNVKADQAAPPSANTEFNWDDDVISKAGEEVVFTPPKPVSSGTADEAVTDPGELPAALEAAVHEAPRVEEDTEDDWRNQEILLEEAEVDDADDGHGDPLDEIISDDLI